MEDCVFKIRKANKTFEPCIGRVNYAHTGGLEEIISIKSDHQHLDLRLDVSGYLYDENGKVTGCNILNTVEEETIPLMLGAVKNINVWVTTVNDDGCPEDVCISYCLELILYDQAPKDTFDFS